MGECMKRPGFAEHARDGRKGCFWAIKYRPIPN